MAKYFMSAYVICEVSLSHGPDSHNWGLPGIDSIFRFQLFLLAVAVWKAHVTLALTTVQEQDNSRDHAHFLCFMSAQEEKLLFSLFLAVSCCCHFPAEKRLDHAYGPY